MSVTLIARPVGGVAFESWNIVITGSQPTVKVYLSEGSNAFRPVYQTILREHFLLYYRVI